MAKSLAFEVIYSPKPGGSIDNPRWDFNGSYAYPSIVLQGTGAKYQLPDRWSQTLGEGRPETFVDETVSYITFKSNDAGGHPVIDADAFDYTILFNGVTKSATGNFYTVSAQFHYNLMPVEMTVFFRPGQKTPQQNVATARLRSNTVGRPPEQIIRYASNITDLPASDQPITFGPPVRQVASGQQVRSVAPGQQIRSAAPGPQVIDTQMGSNRLTLSEKLGIAQTIIAGASFFLGLMLVL